MDILRIPISPPRVDSSKGPPRETDKILTLFGIFGPWKNGLRWPQMGPGELFFPTNPDLVDLLGRTDLNFDIFYVLDCLDPKHLDFQVPRSPNSQSSAGPGRTLRSQPDPSPNAPRDQIRRKEPFLRLSRWDLTLTTVENGFRCLTASCLGLGGAGAAHMYFTTLTEHCHKTIL